jgi:hypothetical protein
MEGRCVGLRCIFLHGRLATYLYRGLSADLCPLALHTALDAGAFEAEIAPISLPPKKRGGEPISFKQDEHPRPQATVESLAKLPPVFAKNGAVTAGNASGICDGAAANVVVSEEAVKRYGLKPLAKVVAYHVNAVEPTVMGQCSLSEFAPRYWTQYGTDPDHRSSFAGIGPVEGIRGVLKKAGLKMEDIDVRRWTPFLSFQGVRAKVLTLGTRTPCSCLTSTRRSQLSGSLSRRSSASRWKSPTSTAVLSVSRLSTRGRYLLSF